MENAQNHENYICPTYPHSLYPLGPGFKACLNFDYISKESEEELRSWLECDMKNTYSSRLT
uniref:Uncharacterized protein n=1 Tax=viral metagenome TaxID=1070528 RepID=A0A6C0IXZ1_9ZZZZ